MPLQDVSCRFRRAGVQKRARAETEGDGRAKHWTLGCEGDDELEECFAGEEWCGAGERCGVFGAE